ncbi:MAG: signal recognition particle-docking protein FtsY, partial [Sphingobacteriales bacterium]
MFSKFTSLFKSKKPDAAQAEVKNPAQSEPTPAQEEPVVRAPMGAEPAAAPAAEYDSPHAPSESPPAQPEIPVAPPPETVPTEPLISPEIPPPASTPELPEAEPLELPTPAATELPPAAPPIIQAQAKPAASFEYPAEPAIPAAQSEPVKEEKLGFFARIKRGLTRTTSQFAEGVGNLFLGKKAIDDELLEDLETQLLVADVGIEATTVIIDDLTARVARKQLDDSDALFAALQENLRNLLLPVEKPLVIPAEHKPFVILVIGVNGAGKTTTIGKLAHRFLSEGKSVMLAAGDTFRAAAVEQLQVWGERNKVPVIAQHTGADSASVIFDALNAARARQVDVLIADTAGRLHNKSHLMEELI